jgi:hypothetical protein
MAGIMNRVQPKQIPRNYHKENLQNMKRKQEEMQQKVVDQQSEAPRQVNKKYVGIESRVVNSLADNR